MKTVLGQCVAFWGMYLKVSVIFDSSQNHYHVGIARSILYAQQLHKVPLFHSVQLICSVFVSRDVGMQKNRDPK